jgi:hypothetical protein
MPQRRGRGSGRPKPRFAETKAKQLAGELVPVDEVESFWRGKLKAFRSRILGIGDRMRSLPPCDHVRLMGPIISLAAKIAGEADIARGPHFDLTQGAQAHMS